MRYQLLSQVFYDILDPGSIILCANQKKTEKISNSNIR